MVYELFVYLVWGSMLTADLERLSILLLEFTKYASYCSVYSKGCGVYVRLVSWRFLTIGGFHFFSFVDHE